MASIAQTSILYFEGIKNSVSKASLWLRSDKTLFTRNIIDIQALLITFQSILPHCTCILVYKHTCITRFVGVQASISYSAPPPPPPLLNPLFHFHSTFLDKLIWKCLLRVCRLNSLLTHGYTIFF